MRALARIHDMDLAEIAMLVRRIRTGVLAALLVGAGFVIGRLT